MSQPDLIRRQLATQATLNKFKGKPFDWARGRHCGALLRFHLKAMGRAVPALPRMRSAVGARAALRGFDVDGMAALMAGPLALDPIAPAMMLMGDAVVADSEEGLGSVFICAGPHKVFGWSEEVPRLSVWDADFAQFKAAFRI